LKGLGFLVTSLYGLALFGAALWFMRQERKQREHERKKEKR
jgi:hypothetical protein